MSGSSILSAEVLRSLLTAAVTRLKSLTASSSKKSLIFMAVAFLLLVWALLNMVTLRFVENNFSLKLIAQNGTIDNLNTPVNAASTEEMKLDVIDFPQGYELSHVSLGSLGRSQYFYMYIQGSMKVKRAGDFLFTAGSDDGFRLLIDGRTISEFVSGRPYGENSAAVRLEAGSHTLRIDYFQGFGPMALKLKVRDLQSGEEKIAGKDLDNLEYTGP